MINSAAVGPAGRAVRCARCKASWHAGGPKDEPDVAVSVDNVIAQTEEEPPARRRTETPPPPAPHAQDAAEETSPETPDPNPAAGNEAPPLEPPGEPIPDLAAAQGNEPEPVAIDDAPPLVPPIEHEPLPETADAEFDSEAAESFDVRRLQLLARRKQSRHSSRWTAVILVLVAFNVALLGAHNEVVRYLPQTASLFAAIGLPVNLRGLKFEDVRISKEVQDGDNILVVEGAIVSETGKPVEVPRLRFAARNATGQEVYTWTLPPPRSILNAGERLQFRSQIPSPPAEASNVMVRFFSPQDAGAK